MKSQSKIKQIKKQKKNKGEEKTEKTGHPKFNSLVVEIKVNLQD